MRKKLATATVAPADPEIIRHYHAHIYYDPASSRDRAARLRERVAAAFPDATLGRWHDAPVGPHPQSMYQIAFPTTLLATFLPWLMLNRDGRPSCSIRAPAMPTPITRITPSGWAARCRSGWTSCGKLPTQYGLSSFPAAVRHCSIELPAPAAACPLPRAWRAGAFAGRWRAAPGWCWAHAADRRRDGCRSPLRGWP